ncbi:DUF721 domain-containing protein [bacterium]|nr:DUF721 domain-containing protein [bacterium]
MKFRDQINRQPESLGTILTRALKQKGWNRTLSENQACLDWERAVGEKIALQSKALRVENGVMLVKVSSPVWRMELHYLKPMILKKLNSALNNNLINDIKFV